MWETSEPAQLAHAAGQPSVQGVGEERWAVNLILLVQTVE